MALLTRLITPGELRADPALLEELRSGTPSDTFELRTIGAAHGTAYRTASDIELRELRDGDSERGIYRGGGLGIVYNSRSVNLGGFVEVVKPGAARDVLARSPDIRALFNHDANLVLGRTLADTLTVAERGEEGTEYEFLAPDTSYARDLRVLLERGDITQSSFAFRVGMDGVEWSEDDETGLPLRIIHRFSGLSDMSPVTYPAYPASTAGKRAATLDAEGRSPQEAAEARAAELLAENAQAAFRARERRLRLRARA